MINLEGRLPNTEHTGLGKRLWMYELLLATYLIFNPSTVPAQQPKAVCTPYIQDGKLFVDVEYTNGVKETGILMKESRADAVDVVRFKEMYPCPPPKKEKQKTDVKTKK